MQYSLSGTRDGVETGMVDISETIGMGGGTSGQPRTRHATGRLQQNWVEANGSRAVWHLAAQAGAVMMLGAARRGGVL